MKIVIETERFYMRELNPDDAPMFYALNLNPEVTRYTGDTAFNSIAEAMDFLENYKDYKLNGFGRWVIVSKEHNQSWGWCGLKKRDNGDIDMGYRIFQEKWGKGCATECGSACLKYAFESLDIEEILAEAVVENSASFKVMERLGFSFNRHGEDHGYKTKIYTLNKSDYIANKK
jgi:RimJ/RimL family protein N-acetyltransferase